MCRCWCLGASRPEVFGLRWPRHRCRDGAAAITSNGMNRHKSSGDTTSAYGSKPKCRHACDLVAIRCKADTTRTSQMCRDRPGADTVGGLVFVVSTFTSDFRGRLIGLFPVVLADAICLTTCVVEPGFLPPRAKLLPPAETGDYATEVAITSALSEIAVFELLPPSAQDISSQSKGHMEINHSFLEVLIVRNVHAVASPCSKGLMARGGRRRSNNFGASHHTK